MGKNTTKKQSANASQAVLEEAVKTSEEIKMAADFTDLGAAVDYAMTITDLAKREAYFANLKPLRDITAFDFYSRVKKPLTEMQTATAAGNKAAADKAAVKVTEGLEAFAEISPEFRTYVKGLEDRIAALEGNDHVQDTRLDKIEACLAALTRGEQVKPFNPHKGQRAQPTPTKPIPVPPKAEDPITDGESLARAAGTEYEEPEHKQGFFSKIANAFRLGTGQDESLADSNKPDPRKYAGPMKTDAATSGAQGKE